MISESSRIRLRENHQWRQTQDGKVMVFPRYREKRPDFHGFFELGYFETMVWRFLQDGPTAGELRDKIAEEISQTDDVDQPSPEELWKEIVGFLEELMENDLVRVERYVSDDRKP